MNLRLLARVYTPYKSLEILPAVQKEVSIELLTERNPNIFNRKCFLLKMKILFYSLALPGFKLVFQDLLRAHVHQYRAPIIPH